LYDCTAKALKQGNAEMIFSFTALPRRAAAEGPRSGAALSGGRAVHGCAQRAAVWSDAR